MTGWKQRSIYLRLQHIRTQSTMLPQLQFIKLIHCNPKTAQQRTSVILHFFKELKEIIAISLDHS